MRLPIQTRAGGPASSRALSGEPSWSVSRSSPVGACQEKSSAARIAEATPWGHIQTIGGDTLMCYCPVLDIGFSMLSDNRKTTDDPCLLEQREYLEKRVLMRTSNQTDMLQLQSDTGELVLSNNQYRLGQSTALKTVAGKSAPGKKPAPPCRTVPF